MIAPREGTIRLLNAITSTGIGGAQSMLVKLLETPSAFGGFDQTVLSLMVPGEHAERLAHCGHPVETLGMRNGMPSPLSVIRLIQLSRANRPDLMVGWMHHAGLAVWYAAAMVRPRPAVIWNVRHSISDMALEKTSTRLILGHSARLTDRLDALIFNSRVAEAQYKNLGYCTDRAVVIPNGFDTDYFQPRADARSRLLRLFGIEGKRPVIGMIARNHPMKDPENLLAAMRKLWAEGQEADLLIVGPGMDRLQAGDGAASRIFLSGQRDDIADWLSGLDLLVLPSAWGEAFPNILGEAMACGVVCIATDVGDSRAIIGAHGIVVPPKRPEALYEAMTAILRMSPDARRALGTAARRQVIDRFSLQAVAEQYATLYRSVLKSSISCCKLNAA